MQTSATVSKPSQGQACVLSQGHTFYCGEVQYLYTDVYTEYIYLCENCQKLSLPKDTRITGITAAWNMLTDRWTDRQMDRQTDGLTARQLETDQRETDNET